MASRDHVEAVLARIRPVLQADGGDIELVAFDGSNASVRFTGVCASCPSAHLTLHMGVETALRAAIDDFGDLHLV